MDEIRYKELMSKLDIEIDSFRKQLVSPAQMPGVVDDYSGIFITKDLNVEHLSKSEKLLTHALLHKLYSEKSKTITKKDIEQLHKDVSKFVDHSRFDKLDDTL